MIVLKQNLLTLAVATALFALPLATLQADDLPPPPPGPYVVDGAQALPEAEAATEDTAETETAVPQGLVQMPMPNTQMQQQMMQGYQQYYRPQIQYIYVVPMMMPKMTAEQKQQMQQQMMQMYSGQQMPMMHMQQQNAEDHAHEDGADHDHDAGHAHDDKESDAEQQEEKNES